MLVSGEVARKVVSQADLSQSDRVLEIGAGQGILTSLLAESGGQILSYEIDRALFEHMKVKFAPLKNVKLVCGDPFSEEVPKFDVCVTSLPYSESLRFIKWAALKSGSFKRIVAIVQKEFADKLTALPGGDSYRAVSVIAQCSFVIEKLQIIHKTEFKPQPRVISQLIRLSPRKDISQPFFDKKRFAILNRLFSNRGKLVSAALRKILQTDAGMFEQSILSKRIEALSEIQFSQLISTLGQMIE